MGMSLKRAEISAILLEEFLTSFPGSRKGLLQGPAPGSVTFFGGPIILQIKACLLFVLSVGYR